MPAEWEPHAAAGCCGRSAPTPGAGAAARQEAIAAGGRRRRRGRGPVTSAPPLRVRARPGRRCRRRCGCVELSSDDAWMRDVGPTFVRRRPGRPARGRLGVQRLGRVCAAGSTRRGTATTGRPRRSPRWSGATVPGAARARGRLDRRRRRGHAATTEECLLNPNRNPELARGRSSASCATTSAWSAWCGSAPGSSTTRPTATSTTSRASPRPGSSRSPGPTTRPTPSTTARAEAARAAAADARGRRSRCTCSPAGAAVPHRGRGRAASTRSPGRSRAGRATGWRARTSTPTSAPPRSWCPARRAPTTTPPWRLAEAVPGAPASLAVPAREILLGGGNVHCITQQVPQHA